MRELKRQFVSALLAILTVAGIVAAVLNFQQNKRYQLPDDGVIWTDNSKGQVEAQYVEPDSPAEHAGIRKGDVLRAIEKLPIKTAADVMPVLVRVQSWKEAVYEFARDGKTAQAKIIVGEHVTDPMIFFQYLVGAVYLAIGLFVYLRRGLAPKATQFYVLCLLSFVFSCFHYTGKLNNFDKIMYWGNVTAGLFAPTVFLHFALTFPEAPGWLKGRGRTRWLYSPATLLLAIHVGFGFGWLRVANPLPEVIWLLDRLWLVFLATTYVLGATVLWRNHKRAEDPMVRAQLTWLRNGAIIAVVPFAVMYALPFAFGIMPAAWMKVSVVAMILLPLTWAYAVLRYRLMDVDIIFQQGSVYTLATLAVLGCISGLVLSLITPKELNGPALVALVLIATFVFQPIRAWIQEQMNRYVFYKESYDYRRTLVEFARELASQTNLDTMLDSVAERLRYTLSIDKVAFFLLDESETRFRLHMATAQRDNVLPLDLSFLPLHPAKPYLFFERTRFALDVLTEEWPQSVRHSIADLGLTYYLPCNVRGRTIAYLGASRTRTGDFLTSDDIELLQTLAGSVGIAIENAQLYRSLERKVEEYERLKDYSENIVESINVGILAADLEDRIESWNPQIERFTGVPRDAAIGRRLTELFPEELVEQFHGALDGSNGNASAVYNIYKFPLKQGDRESILNVAIAPLVSKDGAQIGRLIILDDVTDRAVLEQRLVQADKLSSIGLLAAGVAHEVNTPLAVISTYAQMLTKQINGDDPKSRLLEKINKQTFRASEIVNSLLSFSRTSTTDFVDIDVNKLVRETLTLIEHQLEKAQIGVETSLAEGLPPVKGNGGKLQQVLLNLFLNARDAMPSGGQLRISSWTEEGLVRCQVSDTGTGIAAEHVGRIYDPFFTTKAPKKGTGLGLSVTYGIVREHGGEIEVSSRVGLGTDFVINLPASRKKSAPLPESGSALETMTGFPLGPVPSGGVKSAPVHIRSLGTPAGAATGD